MVALLDHVGIERASLFGYSMGTMVALRLLHQLPHRIGPSVLMATGDGLMGMPPLPVPMFSPGWPKPWRDLNFPLTCRITWRRTGRLP